MCVASVVHTIYFILLEGKMSLSVLNYAKSKLLDGDFNMAASYYSRAID